MVSVHLHSLNLMFQITETFSTAAAGTSGCSMSACGFQQKHWRTETTNESFISPMEIKLNCFIWSDCRFKGRTAESSSPRLKHFCCCCCPADWHFGNCVFGTFMPKKLIWVETIWATSRSADSTCCLPATQKFCRALLLCFVLFCVFLSSFLSKRMEALSGHQFLHFICSVFSRSQVNYLIFSRKQKGVFLRKQDNLLTF